MVPLNPPTLTDITQLNYSFEVIVLVMKYSSFCNEGCIDLNSSTLLKAPASARGGRKSSKNERYFADHLFLYFISIEHLY